jgi:hypothetical protein
MNITVIKLLRNINLHADNVWVRIRCMPMYVELTNLLEIRLLKLKHVGSEEEDKQL